MKLCKDCKHFRVITPLINSKFLCSDELLCYRTMKVDAVTGQEEYIPRECRVERKQRLLFKSKYCGPEGKYFIPIKELKPLPPPIPPKTRTRGKND